MNYQNVLKQLAHKYPDKAVFLNPDSNGTVTEIVCEVEPSSIHPEYSLAIAIIDSNKAHFHRITSETYKVIKGKLKLFIEDQELILEQGQSFTIKPGQKHRALGNETWVEVYSEPGWVASDHIPA
jgi:quercetin dioxygenase-like cupin family protein